VGIELLERAIQGGGQLLRAETASGGGPSPVLSPGVLLLTFDLGRIVVSAEPSTRTLAIEYVETGESAPSGLHDASEDEPWWRLLGNPIARVWLAGSDHPGAVCIQFRADDQSPRILTLAPVGSEVEVRLETPPA